MSYYNVDEVYQPEQLCNPVISQRRAVGRAAQVEEISKSIVIFLEYRVLELQRTSRILLHEPTPHVQRSWLGTFDKTSPIFEAVRSLEGNKPHRSISKPPTSNNERHERQRHPTTSINIKPTTTPHHVCMS